MKFRSTFTLCLFLSFNVQAATNSHEQAAKNLLDTMNVEKMLDGMYQQLSHVEAQNLISSNPCLESIREPITQWLVKFSKKVIKPEVYKKELTTIYTQEFTEEELNTLAAFYKTPTGQKFLERAPALTAKGAEIAYREINKSKESGLMDELKNELQAMIDNRDPSKMTPECRKLFEEEKKAKAYKAQSH